MYNCEFNESDFFKLYHPQRGGVIGPDGASYFQGYANRQRGHGIGLSVTLLFIHIHKVNI